MLKAESFLIFGNKQLDWRSYLLLVLLCLSFFLPGFSAIPPVDRDEPRFAQATKQMIETGNYLDIRFQKDVRYNKPIGIYWLQAASVKLLNPRGLNEIWAYRIPSFVGATGAVLMTAALGSLLFGPMAGFIAALMMVSCLLLNVEARLAKTDAMLLFCVLVAQYGLAKVYLARDSGKPLSWSVFFAFWIAQAAGFLIKGPVLLLITFSTLLYLRVTEKTIAWFRSLRPLPGIMLALLITMPWFIAIMLASKGEFATHSAFRDLLAKIWQGQNRGIVPPGAHLLAFPIVFFPASLIAFLSIPGIWRERKNSAIRFCIAWIVFPWVVFELSLTKLPHYVLPLYPAIAMMSAEIFLKEFPGIKDKYGKWWAGIAFGTWLLAGMIIAIGVIFAPVLVDDSWKPAAIVAGILLIVMQGMFFVLLASKSTNSILIMTGGSLLFVLLTFGITIPSLQNVWLTRQIVQVAQQVKPCPELRIVSSAYNEPSLVFMAGTNTRIVEEGNWAADEMLKNSCLLGIIEERRKPAFLAAFDDTSVFPVEVANLHAPNIGSGRKTTLTIYRLADK